MDFCVSTELATITATMVPAYYLDFLRNDFTAFAMKNIRISTKMMKAPEGTFR